MSFKCHSSVTACMATGDGTLSSTTTVGTHARICGGKVDGARAGTLPSALMIGRALASAAGIRVPWVAKERYTGDRVESGVRTLCPPLANRIGPHLADERSGEMVKTHQCDT